MMKVCIFTTVHRPFDVRVFHRQARTLARAGYDVTLLAHGDENKTVQGIHVRTIARPKNRFFRLLSLFRFGFYCFREKANVYHFHDLECLPLGFLLKKVTGRAVIYDCHENYPETAYERVWYPDWVKPLLAKLIARFEPALAKQLDKVICVVADQKARFDAAGCDTALVRNVPRLEIFEQALQIEAPVQNRLIYLGGQSVARGARTLVDIMADLSETHPDIKLLCLGPFNEPLVEAETKAYVKHRGLDHTIEYINMVPHEKVPEYVTTSLIGLIPWQPHQQMLKMISPNKVFEYMACKIPIVASDLPSLKDIIVKSGAGVTVQADHVKAHADAIRKLLSDPDLCHQYAKQGHQYVQTHHNWDIEAQKLLGVYQHIEKASSL
jgi:glycosyltransferase involved in cell wall biosynthesis